MLCALSAVLPRDVGSISTAIITPEAQIAGQMINRWLQAKVTHKTSPAGCGTTASWPRDCGNWNKGQSSTNDFSASTAIWTKLIAVPPRISRPTSSCKVLTHSLSIWWRRQSSRSACIQRSTACTYSGAHVQWSTRVYVPNFLIRGIKSPLVRS